MGIYIYKTPYYWIDDYLPFLMEIMGFLMTISPIAQRGGDYPWASRYLVRQVPVDGTNPATSTPGIPN